MNMVTRECKLSGCTGVLFTVVGFSQLLIIIIESITFLSKNHYHYTVRHFYFETAVLMIENGVIKWHMAILSMTRTCSLFDLLLTPL